VAADGDPRLVASHRYRDDVGSFLPAHPYLLLAVEALEVPVED
jgi:hypothetical protein